MMTFPLLLFLQQVETSMHTNFFDESIWLNYSTYNNYINEIGTAFERTMDSTRIRILPSAKDRNKQFLYIILSRNDVKIILQEGISCIYQNDDGIKFEIFIDVIAQKIIETKKQGKHFVICISFTNQILNYFDLKSVDILILKFKNELNHWLKNKDRCDAFEVIYFNRSSITWFLSYSNYLVHKYRSWCVCYSNDFPYLILIPGRFYEYLRKYSFKMIIDDIIEENRREYINTYCKKYEGNINVFLVIFLLDNISKMSKKTLSNDIATVNIRLYVFIADIICSLNTFLAQFLNILYNSRSIETKRSFVEGFESLKHKFIEHFNDKCLHEGLEVDYGDLSDGEFLLELCKYFRMLILTKISPNQFDIDVIRNFFEVVMFEYTLLKDILLSIIPVDVFYLIDNLVMETEKIICSFWFTWVQRFVMYVNRSNNYENICEFILNNELEPYNDIYKVFYNVFVGKLSCNEKYYTVIDVHADVFKVFITSVL